MTKVDKRERSDLFRARLAEAMRTRHVTQSALARAAGIDRSTVSQILSGHGARLPNAQIVAECAAALEVSADWLLGLTARPETAAALMAESFEITDAPRALIDDKIFAWHQAAEGYKIRHVPAQLPDMLKTHDMLRWEYAPHLGRTIDQAIGASDDRLAWMQRSGSDLEIAMPLFEIAAFVRGEGYYASCPRAVREGQIVRLLALHDELYPRLRVFLFDARRVYSAPVTIFGPLMAVLYIGQHYVALRDSDRVGRMTRNFDGLVREAAIDARDFPAHLRALASER